MAHKYDSALVARNKVATMSDFFNSDGKAVSNR
jgi:hypothetical protein